MSYAGSTRSTTYGPGRGRTLIHWGAVFAGVVWALAITVLLSALWLALAYGSEIAGIRNNIEWFLAGSAMFALLVGGFVAGWTPGVRGWAPGLLNGMTVWGLMLTASLLLGIPSVLGGAAAFGGNVIGAVTNAGTGGAGGAAANQAADTALWAGFWTALIGLVLAALGGALGGASPRDEAMYETMTRDDRGDRRVDVDDDRDLPRTGTDRL
jgi:putative membrane protein (TIGR04086 family)